MTKTKGGNLAATGGTVSMFGATGKSAAEALSRTAPGAMGPLAGAASVMIDYPRTLAIFTAPHAPELADTRCASAVERVARVNAAGAAIRDLPYIEKLLVLAYDYVNKTGTRALEAPLCSLMR